VQDGRAVRAEVAEAGGGEREVVRLRDPNVHLASLPSGAAGQTSSR
jgi:hypothetical protein